MKSLSRGNCIIPFLAKFALFALERILCKLPMIHRGICQFAKNRTNAKIIKFGLKSELCNSLSKFLTLFLFLLLAGCALHQEPKSDTVVSLQLIDRNGMTETISNQERLKIYKSTDFLSAQPYQKVLRVYGRTEEGGVPSKMTSYHSNGQIAQYLEILDGRAKGTYLEWYPNGQKKVEAFLLEGTADLNDVAKLSWVFDQTSTVWDEQGHTLALIEYNKGVLDSSSLYFYPSGELKQILPYQKGSLDGTVLSFSEDGELLEKSTYVLGKREGHSCGFYPSGDLLYEETYQEDLLQEGFYATQNTGVKEGFGKKAVFQNNVLAKHIEIKNGKEEGLVEIFRPNGDLHFKYTQIAQQKTGEEIEYYPLGKDKKLKPKISLEWHQDILHGLVKTWYDNGKLESQREFHNNKKEGFSFAWYKNGDLMCAEEYENNKLLKGSYFKRGEKTPISTIEEGKGMATLYNSDGLFLKKIPYEKGLPIL